MIISVTSLKGGVGKSTIAMNLAVCFQQAGFRVCLVDSDNNLSMMAWHQIRKTNHLSDPSLPKAIPAIQLPDKRQIDSLLTSLTEAFDVVIIDGTPHIDVVQQLVIVSSQLVVIPHTPGTTDIWAMERFLEVYEDLEIQAKRTIPNLFVLNKYNDRTLHDRDNKQYLIDKGVALAQTAIHDRPAAYKDIVAWGKGVLEGDNQKAKEEFSQFFLEVCHKLADLGLIRKQEQSRSTNPEPAANEVVG